MSSYSMAIKKQKSIKAHKRVCWKENMIKIHRMYSTSIKYAENTECFYIQLT